MVNTQKNDTLVCAITQEHLEEVCEIERLCFSEPWSLSSLKMLLEEKAIGVVVVSDGKVVAYGGMTTVLDEGAVTNIATHPDHRGRGFGRAVVGALIETARSRGIRTVFLEVRESNTVARGLYASSGFEECGIRKNFYRSPTESAVQMRADI